MNLTDGVTPPRVTPRPHALARRAFVSILATVALLTVLPTAAAATTVDRDGGTLEVSGDGGEDNRIGVIRTNSSSRFTAGSHLFVFDKGHKIRYVGPERECAGRPTLECRFPRSLRIDGNDGDDVIEVSEMRPSPVEVVSVDPGPGRDTVRFFGVPPIPSRDVDEVRVDLRDGEADDLSCVGVTDGFVVRVRDRDPEDRMEATCNVVADKASGAPPARDATPPRVDFYTRRVHRRGGVLGQGLKATCSATEAGTCSVTGSISRSSARALGIRTRARRYLILRGSTAVPAAGAHQVRLRLTRRARTALRGRRVRELRVLLTATMVDGAGNRSFDPFVVTVRG